MNFSVRLKKVATLFLAAATAVGMTGTVKAAESTQYPDSSTNGSITITKYQDTTASTWDESGSAQTAPTGKTPLKDVEFTVKKVGTISQETDTNGNVQLSYTVDESVKTALSLSDTKVSSTELDAKLKIAYNSNKNVANTLVTGGTAKKTDASGVAKFTELEQGLYLVAETDAPATVTAKSVPFFVSIPSIVNQESGNTSWETDINAYPKNTVGTPTIDKNITAINGTQKETKKETAAIGDKITFTIPMTAIIPADGLKMLAVKDIMGKGLTFDDSSVKIYPMNGSVRGTELSKGTDYTVDTKAGSNNVVFDFQTSYLSSLTAGSSMKYEIEYTATLNENAVLGTSGNENTVNFYYSSKIENKPGTGGDKPVKPEENTPPTDPDHPDTPIPSVPSDDNPPKTVVYTYGIDLTKTGKENSKLANVEFTVTDGTGNQINVKKSGDYYVSDSSGSNTVTSDENGKITIRGLKPGTYKIQETKTNKGYVLLKDPITVVIKQTDADAGDATATVDGKTVTMTDDNINEGSKTALVAMTVINHKGFDLPKTGAAGTAIFAFAGIILVLVAGAILFFRRKTVEK